MFPHLKSYLNRAPSPFAWTPAERRGLDFIYLACFLVAKAEQPGSSPGQAFDGKRFYGLRRAISTRVRGQEMRTVAP